MISEEPTDQAELKELWRTHSFDDSLFCFNFFIQKLFTNPFFGIKQTYSNMGYSVESKVKALLKWKTKNGILRCDCFMSYG